MTLGCRSQPVRAARLPVWRGPALGGVKGVLARERWNRRTRRCVSEGDMIFAFRIS